MILVVATYDVEVVATEPRIIELLDGEVKRDAPVVEQPT